MAQLTNLRNLAIWEGNDAAEEPPTWPHGLMDLQQLEDVTLAHFDLVRPEQHGHGALGVAAVSGQAQT